MYSISRAVAIVLLGGLVASCKRQPTPESICQTLQREKIAEDCKEGPVPVFDVPRHGAQWTFRMAELKESVDPVLGKMPKPSGGIIQFDSIDDRDVAVQRLNGANSVLPVLPFIHKLENPPMVVVMPKHDGALRSQGVLERLYGYSN